LYIQRTLDNYDIPIGMISRDIPCPDCGMEPPYHHWDCGMDESDRKRWLEMVRSTGPCGGIECGSIITESCLSCRRNKR